MSTVAIAEEYAQPIQVVMEDTATAMRDGQYAVENAQTKRLTQTTVEHAAPNVELETLATMESAQQEEEVDALTHYAGQHAQAYSQTM